MTLTARIDAIVRPVAPPERLAALRILIGAFSFVYLCIRAKSLASVVDFNAAQYAPIGIAKLAGQPIPDAAVYATVALAIVGAAAFTVGFQTRLSGPIYAFFTLWVTTYRSSWGMIFHTENLLVLQAILLAVSPCADVWSLDARANKKKPKPSWHYGWPIALMSILAVTTYVLAGVAKLRVSGFEWVTSDVLRNHVAYDNIRKVLYGDFYSPLGTYLVRFDWFWPPLAAFSLAFELFAPLALLHRRIAKVWAVSAWGFHIGVWATMAIFFPYPVLGLAFASFFEPERLLLWLRNKIGSKPAPA